MKKTVKICFVVLLISSIFAGCGKTPQQELAGYWEKTEGKGFSYIEFFEDGKYVSSHTNYEGDFSISGDRIRLEGILVDSKTYTYSVSGNMLTFYDNDGDVYAEYEKTK